MSFFRLALMTLYLTGTSDGKAYTTRSLCLPCIMLGRPALESIGTKELFSAYLESIIAAKGSAGRKTRSMRGFIVV